MAREPFRREKKRARGIERGREGKRRGSSLPPPSLLSLFSRAFSGPTTSPNDEDDEHDYHDYHERRRWQASRERWRKCETTKILGLFRNSISVRRPSDAPTRSSPRHAHSSVHEHATSRASLSLFLRDGWTMSLKIEFLHRWISIDPVSRFSARYSGGFKIVFKNIEAIRGGRKLGYLLKFRVRLGRVIALARTQAIKRARGGGIRHDAIFPKRGFP